jgi:6-phosphogluconolactonase
VSSEPEVVVAQSADQLAADTADRAVSALGAALRDRPVAHLVVTGGGILEQVLAALAEPSRRAAVEWGRVHVWWGDERYVPANSDERNDRPAWSKLFEHVDIDPAKLHRMPASDVGFGEDAEAAAASYAAELAAEADDGDLPRFDVILLGVGPDGHCASLFPGHPGVHELEATVIAVPDSPKPPPVRISLTFRALDAADEVWVIAAGDGKADALGRAIGGAPREDVPVAGPRGRDRTLWLLDQGAAAKLPGR